MSTRAADDANVRRLLNVVASAFDEEDGEDLGQREKLLFTTLLQFARTSEANLDKLATSAVPASLAWACSRVAKRIAADSSDSKAGPAEAPLPLNTLVFVLATITRHLGCAAAVAAAPGALSDLVCCIGATPNSRARMGGRAPLVLHADEHFVGSVLEVLWNMLEGGDTTAAAVKLELSQRDSPVIAAAATSGDGAAAEDGTEDKPLPPPAALCAFADCFHRLLTGSHATVSARQLRNDAATVLMLLIDDTTASAIASAQCPAGGLLTTVARGFTAAEMPSKHPDCKKIRLDTSAEDFELHKVLQACLERATAVGGPCRSAVAQGNAMGLLLEYGASRTPPFPAFGEYSRHARRTRSHVANSHTHCAHSRLFYLKICSPTRRAQDARLDQAAA
jgi:hypothetical protein